MPTIQKKVCLLGEYAVGKTSLVRQFVEGKFDDKYLSTIGTKINRKRLPVEQLSPDHDLTLLIWDLAGGEKFDRMMSNYYRGASGAVLVCDLTRPETAEALASYAQNFWSVNADTPLVVVGNKADLTAERRVSEADLATAAEHCQAPYFTSSAKTGENVETLFSTLAQQIIQTP